MVYDDSIQIDLILKKRRNAYCEQILNFFDKNHANNKDEPCV